MNPDSQPYTDDYHENSASGQSDSTGARHATGSQTPRRQNGSGLPLRGLAMVLVSVAVLFGLWGVYAMTSDDDGETTASTSSDAGDDNTDAADGNDNDEASGDAHQDEGAEGDNKPGDEGANGDDANGGADARPDADEGADSEAGDDAPGAGAGAGAGAGSGASGPLEVTVLNNSTITGLADRVSQDLESEGRPTRGTGNLPEGESVLRENTVFFPADNPDAERQARELADRIGGVARENADFLPREATDNNGLTMVLIGEVAV